MAKRPPLEWKKVAGLLLEAVSLPDRPEMAYLIGCGLNLTLPPHESRYPATSFQEESIFLSYDTVVQKLTSSLQHYINLWKEKGFIPIQTLWMESAANLQKMISFELQGKIYEGFFEGIDGEGTMLLKTPKGLLKFSAGEVLANMDLKPQSSDSR